MTESKLDHDIFISKLIRMTKKKDKEFKKFIDKNLFPLKSNSNSIDYINGNIDALRTMDRNQQILVKARATHFEDMYDLPKYFPILIALMGAIISMYGLVKELSTEMSKDSSLVIFLTIIVTVVLISLVTWLFIISVGMRSTAIYFNSLVTNIKYDKE